MKSFTLEGFAKELNSIRAKVPINLTIAARVIGETVEAKAKAEIGEYQRGDMGGFAPWAELTDGTKKDRVRKGYTENDPGLRSGGMRDSIEHNVSAMSVAIGSNDDKLLWFEDGTSKQPPRAVVKLAAHRSTEELRAIAKLAIERIF